MGPEFEYTTGEQEKLQYWIQDDMIFTESSSFDSASQQK